MSSVTVRHRWTSRSEEEDERPVTMETELAAGSGDAAFWILTISYVMHL